MVLLAVTALATSQLIPQIPDSVPVAEIFANDEIGLGYVQSVCENANARITIHGGLSRPYTTHIGPEIVHVEQKNADRVRNLLLRDPHFIGDVLQGTRVLKTSSGPAWQVVKTRTAYMRDALIKGKLGDTHRLWSRRRYRTVGERIPLGTEIIALHPKTGEYWHAPAPGPVYREWRTLAQETLRKLAFPLPKR